MDDTNEGNNDFDFDAYLAEIEAINKIIREFSWELLGTMKSP